MIRDIPTALSVLSAVVLVSGLLLALTIAVAAWQFLKPLKVITQLPGPDTPEVPFRPGDCGAGCCTAAEGGQLVPSTPVVSEAEVAASIRRKTARDRVRPDIVTRAAETH